MSDFSNHLVCLNRSFLTVDCKLTFRFVFIQSATDGNNQVPVLHFFFFYIDKFTIFFHSLQFSHFCRTRLGRIWNKFLKNKYRKENLAFLILIENHRTSWDIYRISPFSIKKYQDVIFGPYHPALDWGISGFSVCDPSIRL